MEGPVGLLGTLLTVRLCPPWAGMGNSRFWRTASRRGAGEMLPISPESPGKSQRIVGRKCQEKDLHFFPSTLVGDFYRAVTRLLWRGAGPRGVISRNGAKKKVVSL